MTSSRLAVAALAMSVAIWSGGRLVVLGSLAVLGDGWCVGCVVCGCVEVDGGLLVADGAEESGEVAERRPLLDPAAGAGPVVDEGLVAVQRLGEAAGAGEGGDVTDRGDGFEECGAAVRG